MDSKLIRILSAVEVGDRMEKSLCFLCDEPFTLEHQSVHKKIRIVVKEMDEDEHEIEGHQPHLSLSTATTTQTSAPAKTLFLCESATASLFFAPEPVGTLKATPRVLDELPQAIERVESPSFVGLVAKGAPCLVDRCESFSELKESLNIALYEQSEAREEDPPEVATDTVADDYSLADPVLDIVDKQKDVFPLTMTSFDLFGDDVVSAAAVPAIHIGPFDPGPQLPIHVPYFHSSRRHHFSRFFAQFDPGIAQENGSIPEDIIRNVVSATEDGFLTLVRRSYGIKPLIAAMGSCCLVGVIWKGTLYIANLGDSRAVIGKIIGSNKIIAEQLTRGHNASKEEIGRELKSLHPEEFTSCAATIGYPLHSMKTGLEVTTRVYIAGTFLASFSLFDSWSSSIPIPRCQV